MLRLAVLLGNVFDRDVNSGCVTFLSLLPMKLEDGTER